MSRTKRSLVLSLWALPFLPWIGDVWFVEPALNWIFVALCLNVPLVLLWSEASARILGRIALAVSFLWWLGAVFHPGIETRLLAQGETRSGARIAVYPTYGSLLATSALDWRWEPRLFGLRVLSWGLEGPSYEIPASYDWNGEAVKLEQLE